MTWQCLYCGHSMPFGHGDVFRYVREGSQVVYKKVCPKCKNKTMTKKDQELTDEQESTLRALDQRWLLEKEVASK
jgi:ribosomal protein L24E